MEMIVSMKASRTRQNIGASKSSHLASWRSVDMLQSRRSKPSKIVDLIASWKASPIALVSLRKQGKLVPPLDPALSSIKSINLLSTKNGARRQRTCSFDGSEFSSSELREARANLPHLSPLQLESAKAADDDVIRLDSLGFVRL